MTVRKVALENFGENNIRMGQPFSDIGDVLVPIYLLHRYQIEAVSKILGGLDYTYALRGDGQFITELLSPKFQMDALDALTLSEKLLQLIPPRAAGRGRTRESFNPRTGLTFDGISPAETAANLTCRTIFHSARANRLIEYHSRKKEQPGLEKVLDRIFDEIIKKPAPSGLAGEVKRNIDFVVLDHLLSLTINRNSSPWSSIHCYGSDRKLGR